MNPNTRLSPADYARSCVDRYLQASADARRDAEVALLMAVHDRDCTGNGCDQGRACPRHARTMEVAGRYLRITEQRRREQR